MLKRSVLTIKTKGFNMTKISNEMRADMDKLYNFIKDNQPVFSQKVYDFMNVKYTRLTVIRRHLTKEGHYISNINPYSVWLLPAEMTEENEHQYKVLKANVRSLNQWDEIIYAMPGHHNIDRLTPEQEEQRRKLREKRLFEERSEFVQKVYNVSLLIEDEVFEHHDDLNKMIQKHLDILVRQTFRTELDELKLVMSWLYFTWMQHEFDEIDLEDVTERISFIRHELIGISKKLSLNVDNIG
jgi:hypothetical protein